MLRVLRHAVAVLVAFGLAGCTAESVAVGGSPRAVAPAQAVEFPGNDVIVEARVLSASAPTSLEVTAVHWGAVELGQRLTLAAGGDFEVGQQLVVFTTGNTDSTLTLNFLYAADGYGNVYDVADRSHLMGYSVFISGLSEWLAFYRYN